MDATFVLSLWGAVLSTILALLELWKSFWRDRIRFETSYFFTGDDFACDEIIIANISSSEIAISAWRLYWKPIDKTGKEFTLSDPEDSREFFMKGKSTKKFEFCQDYKLEPNDPRFSDTHRMYIKLHVFGTKKPYDLLVYPQAS